MECVLAAVLVETTCTKGFVFVLVQFVPCADLERERERAKVARSSCVQITAWFKFTNNSAKIDSTHNNKNLPDCGLFCFKYNNQQ
jgi:hypothetical protein